MTIADVVMIMWVAFGAVASIWKWTETRNFTSDDLLTPFFGVLLGPLVLVIDLDFKPRKIIIFHKRPKK